MNKTFVLACLFICNHIHAQNIQIDSPPPHTMSNNHNAIKINPIAFFYSTMEFHYERYITNSVSFQIGAGFCGKEKKESYSSSSLNSIYELTNKVTGYTALGALKIYFKNPVPLKGFYFAPMVRYNNYNFEIYNGNVSTGSIPYSFVKYNMNFIEGSVCFGYQLVAGSRFTLDTFLGGGIRMANDNKPVSYTRNDYVFETIERQNTTGVLPRAGVQIGIAF
jgi:hypothetical protein